MINFTKLLGGNPTVSDALKAVNRAEASDHGVPSPIVVFNITRRCNLDCMHCYLESKNQEYKGELESSEIKKVIDDLSQMQIPVLLLSGGEPLVHKDIFQIIDYAKSKKLRVGLSTNGTLITKKIAKQLKSAGIDYVGVSIDGLKGLHDKFRNLNGAFDQAMKGIINCLESEIKTGVRFTNSKLNYTQLPQVIDLCIKEQIPRFCMYHLVYSGRGESLLDQDIDNKTRREIALFLVEKTIECQEQGRNLEILTVDNHADGVFIYNHLKKKDPVRAQQVLEMLRLHGGCSLANKIVDISPFGDVYACQFWHNDSLGNILEKSFLDIWYNQHNEHLCQLRCKTEHLKGKCGKCSVNIYCGGCRVRAYVQSGDFWQEDPCCYLTDEERECI
ncbi:MAG: radical SAM protein [PVC group bacterium]|nr:radical SAM protein [PVC group bacterium]